MAKKNEYPSNYYLLGAFVGFLSIIFVCFTHFFILFYILNNFFKTFFQSIAVGTISIFLKLKNNQKTFLFLQLILFLSTASLYDSLVVVQALFLTMAIVVCLTVYTFQTKRDFKTGGALLFSLLTLLIFGGFMQVTYYLNYF